MKKKFFSSFLIALLLLVNFTTSAFALEDPLVDFEKTGSITVHKYSFEGDKEDGNGTGLELNKDLDIPEEATPLPGTVYEIQQTHKLVQVTNNQEEWQEEWVELETLDEPIKIETDSEGVATLDNLNLGRYTLKEIYAPGHLIDPVTYEIDVPLTVADGKQLLYDVHVYPKNTPVEVFKEQRDVNEPEWKNATTTLVGETVDFRLLAIAPTDIDEFVKFALSDQIDSRLNYKADSTTVYINDRSTTLVADVDYTLTKPTGANNDTLEVSLKKDRINELTAGDKLYVEFSAVVNDSALGKGEIKNTAKVAWDNDKGAVGEKESEPTITTPVEGKLTITKVAKNNTETLLSGATFKLERLNEDDDWVDVADSEKTTGETGELTWNQLVAGNYRLVETKAPDGYNLLANPIKFSIDGDNLTRDFQVENMPEGLIPQTGGMGTLLFTVSGLLLMGFAGFNLMRKRQEAK